MVSPSLSKHHQICGRAHFRLSKSIEIIKDKALPAPQTAEEIFRAALNAPARAAPPATPFGLKIDDRAERWLLAEWADPTHPVDEISDLNVILLPSTVGVPKLDFRRFRWIHEGFLDAFDFERKRGFKLTKESDPTKAEKPEVSATRDHVFVGSQS